MGEENATRELERGEKGNMTERIVYVCWSMKIKELNDMKLWEIQRNHVQYQLKRIKKLKISL